MTSRERVRKAIEFKETDRVPFDLGATFVTGISAFELNNLRVGYGLEKRPVKVFEPLMFLGEVQEDLLERVGGDFIGIFGPDSLLGYENSNWKNWNAPYGGTYLVGNGFTYTIGEDGMVYLFAKSNVCSKAAARMPPHGFYFDHIYRQIHLSADHEYNARVDYSDQYAVYSDRELKHFEKCAKNAYENTDKAIIFNCGIGGLGDFFHIPGSWLEDPRGIRNLEDWMMAPFLHPEYVMDLYEMQTEICLKNLSLAYEAMGDLVDIVYVSGTDFGTQNGPMLSLNCYREFYKPFMIKIMNWIHENTSWKTMNHTCGAVEEFIEDFIETGLDILNPVQVSAKGMAPQNLKEKYGNRLVFCGGTVDPQTTLATGSPLEVYEEAKHNIEILSKGGGFIGANIHNIQAETPVENIKALISAITGK